MESKQTKPNRAVYALLALMLIVFIAGVWIARSSMQRAISSPPAAAETAKPGPLSSATQPAPGGAGATPTPTEFIPIVVIQVEQADVRSGPHPIFLLLIQVKRGISLRAVGRNAENTYLLILLPDNRQGWIEVEAAAFDFDLQLLPVVASPPTPTFTPSPTPEAAPGKPQPTHSAEPYGQGGLAPPQIPGVAPSSHGSPARRALGLVSATLLSLLVLSQRGWTARPAMARLAQLLSALF
ncbi:MAG: hypothetical protein JXA78_02740 [Anaerolineales bacterium]|nr:hypothetical protein [Anaerolineales bacterium]